jgi:hypothetical protein
MSDASDLLVQEETESKCPPPVSSGAVRYFDQLRRRSVTKAITLTVPIDDPPVIDVHRANLDRPPELSASARASTRVSDSASELVANEGPESISPLTAVESTNQQHMVTQHWNYDKHRTNIFSTPPGHQARLSFLGEFQKVSPALQRLLLINNIDKIAANPDTSSLAMQSCDLSPSTVIADAYIIPRAGLKGSANAMTDGRLFASMGFCRFHGREVLATGTEAEGWQFLTAESYPAGHVSYGSRDLRLHWMLKRIAVFQGGLMLLIAASWIIVLIPPVRATVSAFSVVRWAFDYLGGMFYGVIEGNEARSALAMLFLSLIVVWSGLVALFARKASNASLLNLEVSDIPVVLRMLLKPDTNTTMVSYAWASSTSVHAARSLAFSLPDAWIDVRALSAGTHISVATSKIVRSCECLVILLSPQILDSEASMWELIHASLARSSYHQVSLVLIAGGSIEEHAGVKEAERLMIGHGFRVFRDGTLLLRYLAEHVYAASEPSDAQRALRFCSLNGSPQLSLRRNLCLPSPATLRQQSIFPPIFSGVFNPPAGFVRSGSKYLSAGCEHIGLAVFLSDEQLRLIAVPSPSILDT